MYSNQEIFDKVALHLLKQNARSIGAICYYRGCNGLRCAAGCLIPDDVYESNMEGKIFSTVYHGWPKIRALFDQDQITLINELQKIHDHAGIRSWREELIQLGRRHGLIINTQDWPNVQSDDSVVSESKD